MAIPTPVFDRSSVSSAVLGAISMPIIEHATRPIAPSMHVRDKSTLRASPTTLDPFSSGTDSRMIVWPAIRLV
jgi:hypothetical protein